jgi:hypothetical protein
VEILPYTHPGAELSIGTEETGREATKKEGNESGLGGREARIGCG